MQLCTRVGGGLALRAGVDDGDGSLPQSIPIIDRMDARGTIREERGHFPGGKFKFPLTFPEEFEINRIFEKFANLREI